jgi:hypothetical protein
MEEETDLTYVKRLRKTKRKLGLNTGEAEKRTIIKTKINNSNTVSR